MLVPEVLDEAGLRRSDKFALEALELLLRLRPALLLASQISTIWAISANRVVEDNFEMLIFSLNEFYRKYVWIMQLKVLPEDRYFHCATMNQHYDAIP